MSHLQHTRSPGVRTPKKRLQFDATTKENSPIFSEPSTPMRKGLAAVKTSKTEPADAGVNSSLEVSD
jgi:hypothetical protein